MSKSKKFNTIKDPAGLNTGNTYIRAVVNCHGKFWLEIFTVVKKPTLQDIKTMGKNWMFDIKPLHETYSKRRTKADKGCFVSSFVNHRKLHSINRETGVKTVVFDGALFPFSNKVFNFLKNNMGDTKQFLQAINPTVTITDEVMKTIQEEFDFMIFMDEEQYKQLMAA